MDTLCFTYYGEPMSKGSKLAEVVTRGDGSIVYKEGRPLAIVRENKQSVKERDAKAIAAVALAAREQAGHEILRGVALAVTLRYYMPSPKERYGTGRNAGVLKERAVARPATRPDVDKMVRHTLDALTGVIYADDGQVVDLLASKRYVEHGEEPRQEVEITVLEQQTVGVQVPDEQMALVA